MVEVFDTLGNSTVNEYDALNRLVKTTDALNQVTEFGYDGAGNRTSVKDPKGNITTWAYDDLKRVLSETTPAGVIVNHEYDALNKTRTVDAKGQVTTYHYDNRHRLTQMKLYVDAQTPTPHNVRTYGYDNAGLLLSVTESADATVNVSYTYDALGKTLSETSRGFTHSYQYDLAGNRVKSTYGTGRVVHHAYDGVNRLISLTEAGRVTNWEYDLAGRCVAMTQGNGLVQRQSYDAHGRLVQRALYDDDLPSALMTVELAYDALGNVMKQQERWNPTAGVVPASNRTTTMAYDLSSRLVNETAVQHADGSSVSTTYEYDAASNRSKKIITGGSETGTSTYTYNALNQLTGFEERAPNEILRKSVSYTYDLNGNRTNRVEDGVLSHEYAWDWNNRLSHVQKHVGGENGYWYGYDYRMRRTTRQEGTAATAITYSGGVSVAEYQVLDAQQNTLNTQPSVEYQRGPDMGGGVGGLLYSLRNSTPKFNLSNGRGDVVAQSNNAGNLTWTASYEAYGKRPVETGTNADRQRANTKEEDPTGLLYEGFRYRDLETGTWLSRDPAGFVDGPNLYAYVRQNPWTKWDPLGLQEGYQGYWEEVGEIWCGYGNAIKGTITGIVDVAVHPIDTATGVKNAVMNPAKTWEGVKTSTVQTAKAIANGDNVAAGEAIFGVLETALPFSKAKTVSKLKNVEKVANISDVAVDLANKAGDISNIAEVASLGADAEQGAAAESGAIWQVGRHGDMPSPRPTGTQSHHGVNSVWMEANVPTYSAADAPAVLMQNDPFHNATRGIFNRMRSEIATRQGVSPRNVNWSQVQPGTAWRLAEEQFEAAQTPLEVREEYFRQFNQYLDSQRQ